MSRWRCADLATWSRGKVVTMQRCEAVDQIRPRWFRLFVVCTWVAAILVVVWLFLALALALTGHLVPI
jgi:hypothetical protein